MKYLVAISAAAVAWVLTNEAWVWLTARHAPIGVEVVIPVAAFFFAWKWYAAFFEQKGGSSAGAPKRK